MNYLASPPLVIAYALAGSMDVDLNNDPLGQDPDGNDVFLHDIWPSPQEVQRVIDHAVSAEMFSQGLRRRLRRHRAVAEPAHARRRHLRVGPAEHLRPQAPVLRRHAGRAVPGRGHHRRPHPGGARRLGDHRPHLAGRLDQGRQPRRQVPARARRRPPRLQLLRLPPREPRGHDPRHVRQHPAAQPAGARHRGWRHQEPPDRRDDDDLRRLARLHRRRHPAGRAGRQGVRLGLVARLGGQGDGAARASRRSSPRATSASTGRT